jgi:hypothetical protein
MDNDGGGDECEFHVLNLDSDECGFPGPVPVDGGGEPREFDELRGFLALDLVVVVVVVVDDDDDRVLLL